MNRHPELHLPYHRAVGSDDDGNFVYTITDNRITRLGVRLVSPDTVVSSDGGPIRGDTGGGKHQGRAATENGGSAADVHENS